MGRNDRRGQPPSQLRQSASADAPTKSNYIRSSCTREGLDPARAVLSSPLYQDIRLTTTTYESPAAASAGLLYLSAGVDNTSTVKVDGVGEEAYVYLDFDQQAVLAFRQGRVVGELLFNFANQTGTADQMVDTLSPLATKIAGLLASYT